MTRITNSLFESIRQITEAKVEGKAEGAGKVDAAHFCATHVEHSLYGEGECISEQHAKPNADGTIDWYNVKFADGNVRKIQTEAVKVKKAAPHEHFTPEGDTIEEKKLHDKQQVLDVHEPKKDKLTAKDFEMLRKGKKKVVKQEEAIEEFDPLKHVAKDKQTPALKSAAKGVDRGDYGARAALMKAGKVKDDRGPRGVTQKEPVQDLARARKVNMGEEVEESVSETIVKHNDFTIEITDNPTFGDFLKAVQSIVRTDEESMQQEIVAIAEQAFAENYEEIIIESFTRMELEDKIAAHRKAGNTVSDDKYSTKNGQPYAEYVVTDQEGGRKKYIHHGTRRGVESMSSVTVKK